MIITFDMASGEEDCSEVKSAKEQPINFPQASQTSLLQLRLLTVTEATETEQKRATRRPLSFG